MKPQAVRRGVTLAILGSLAGTAHAELVFYSPTRTDADLSIYVTDTQAGTDCLIFQSSTRAEAKDKPAVWFTSPTRSDATLVVYLSRTRRDADRTVYFTDSRARAKCSLP